MTVHTSRRLRLPNDCANEAKLSALASKVPKKIRERFGWIQKHFPVAKEAMNHKRMIG